MYFQFDPAAICDSFSSAFLSSRVHDFDEGICFRNNCCYGNK